MARAARSAAAKKKTVSKPRGSRRAPAKGRGGARRTAEEARKVILDAAEQRLAQVGPAGLRLQEVAKEAGVAHPTILHHFGSREGLVHAVVQRAIGALHGDLMQELQQELAGGTADPVKLVNRAFLTLNQRGHARLWVWLALSGQLPPSVQPWVREIATVSHAVRAKRRGSEAQPFEDSLFRAMLAGLALFGDAIIGDAIRESAGLADDPKAATRFRAWLGTFLAEALETTPG
jgi:AcrR family transcriptional regulator